MKLKSVCIRETKPVVRLLNGDSRFRVSRPVIVNDCLAVKKDKTILNEYRAKVQKRPKDIACVVNYGRLRPATCTGDICRLLKAANRILL